MAKVEQQILNEVGVNAKKVGRAMADGLDAARFKAAPLFPYPWDGYVGLRFENQGFNTPVYLATVAPLELIFLLEGAEFKGRRLPKEGGALIVANHVKPMDMWLIQDLAAREGRTISTFARNTLRDPNAPEADYMKERRRKSGGSKEDGWFTKHVFSRYIGGVGCYWINLGMNDAQSRAEGKRAAKDLRKGKLVGIFPQGTRLPELDLLDVEDGVAGLAKLAFSVPIYPVGFNYIEKEYLEKIERRIERIVERVINRKKELHFLFQPITVVGEPFTYKDIPKPEGDDEIKVALRFIIDKVAECVYDPRQKLAWTLNRKFGLTRKEIERFVPVFGSLTAEQIYEQFNTESRGIEYATRI